MENMVEGLESQESLWDKVAAIEELMAILQEEFQVGFFGHIFGIDRC